MLLDLLFPKTCLGCGRLGCYICGLCEKQLSFISQPKCYYCRQPSTTGTTHRWCQVEGGLDGHLSMFVYNYTAKKIVKGIKYRLIRAAFGDLFHTFTPQALSQFFIFKKIWPQAYLIPVPLHPDRQARRGFNQADIIAQYFSQLLGFPVLDIARRVKNTPPQAQTASRTERQENMKHAFSLTQDASVSGKTVILVDDVFTTGSTCLELTKELKNAGVQNVFVFTLARG